MSTIINHNQHFKKLENMFLHAPINQLYQPTIKISDGKCEIEWEVMPIFLHGGKSLHGSVYFKLLDDVAFFSCNSIIYDVFVVTGSFEIKFLKPITEGKLLAIGEMTKNLGNKLEARAKLFTEKGDLCAQGSGIFVKTKILLTSLESYKI